MSGEFKHDPDSIDDLAKRFDRHSRNLEDSHKRHHGRARSAFGRTKGKGGLAAAAEQGISKLMDSMEQGQKALTKHLKDIGRGLDMTSRNHRANEQKILDDLKKFGANDRNTPAKPGRGGGGGPRGGSHPKGKGREQVKSPRTEGRPQDTRCGGGEPVDMATGRMYIDQVDASLPGSLPLEFTRSFESGLLTGRWMGPRWICTFDERLEIDEHGVVHVRADRITQSYPHPEPGDPVHAEAGSRHELELVDGLFTVTDPSTGLVRTFTPTPDGSEALLTEVRDRHGRHYTLAYDADGTPLSLTHSGGYRLLVTADKDRITALRLADAGETGGDALLMRYSYTHGHLTAVYNSSGKPMRFANDATGRVLSWTDRNDSQYRYTYDAHDRVTDEGGTTGALRFTFTYGDPDPATGLRTHTETNALGHTTTYTVNEHAQITTITDPLGHTTTHERDEYDRLLTETDPLGRTTTYEYDGAGDLIAVTRPDGARSSAAYTGRHGRPTLLVEADGATWQQEFDDSWSRTSLTDPAGSVTRYSHDVLGHLASVTDALGGVVRVVCNPAGQPLSITDATGATTGYTYDAFGRTSTITDPLGAVTRLGWTTEGRPASRTTPDGHTETWTYDGEGNCLTHTDQLGQVTGYEYTHFETLAARTTPDGARVTFTHDAHMQLVAVTDPLGRTWHYEYDPAGRLIGETDFQRRTVGYGLDAAGQLVHLTGPQGRRTTLQHDVLGRVTARETNGSTTTFRHDVAGRIVAASSPDCELLRSFDVLGRLVGESVNGRVLTNSWDELGRRTGRVTPAGHTSAWSYDPAGRPVTLTTPAGDLGFHYDAAGREHERTVGAGLTLTSAWDDLHRLVGQSVRVGDDLLQQRGYSYRADGRLVGVDDRLAGRRAIELDAIGRVTRISAESWTETYAYDLAGNQTHADWPATAATAAATGERSYTDGRLTAAGKLRYEYDAAGQVTLRQKQRLSKKPDTWYYTWDAEGRLNGLVTPDGTRWRYLYDPLGRRIAKAKLGDDGESVVERTDFVWDGMTLAEQTVHASYLPGPHTLSWDHRGLRPIAQTEAIAPRPAPDLSEVEVERRFFAIVTDLVGTPTELLDPATGSIAWRATPTLWGNTSWPGTSTTYTPLRFPGQYFDPESRLHYNVHRYYDPETGRYTSPDPLGLVPDPNPDTYVLNPHSGTDALGLSPHELTPEEQHEAVNKLLKDDQGTPLGREGSPRVREVTADELDRVHQGLRDLLGPGQITPIKDKTTGADKGSIETWFLGGRKINITHRDFSSSGGGGDRTIDFTNVPGLEQVKRIHIKE
ncbi:DUF6531 domain-containing protein [Kitasatospora sp. NPDC096147]|uniref:DUF6531 domain-containing protein n=1 Tax=Kitasatospora sp. NPDC096147 TaxID=3364093 RepID=UPI00380B619B